MQIHGGQEEEVLSMQIFYMCREKTVIKQASSAGFVLVASVISGCAIIMSEY